MDKYISPRKTPHTHRVYPYRKVCVGIGISPCTKCGIPCPSLQGELCVHRVRSLQAGVCVGSLPHREFWRGVRSLVWDGYHTRITPTDDFSSEIYLDYSG